MITPEQREQAFEQASDTKRELYDSYQSGMKLENISKTHGVQKHFTFLTAVGDVVLGFYQTAQLPQLLQSEVGVTADQASAITADVLDFLAPLQLSSAAVTTDPVPVAVSEKPTAPVIRTMANDMAYVKEHPDAEPPVYTSTQTAILREGRAQNTPPPSAPTVPPAASAGAAETAPEQTTAEESAAPASPEDVTGRWNTN